MEPTAEGSAGADRLAAVVLMVSTQDCSSRESLEKKGATK